MRSLVAILSLFAVTTGLRAQITVDVVFDQETYLANEPLIAKVRIANASGQVLTMGRGSEWLTFSIDLADGGVVSQTGAVPVEGEFKSEPSTTVIRRINLQPYFNITQPGRYKVSATVKIPQWDDAFTSPVRYFNVSNGTKLWEAKFGLPAIDPKAGAPEVRRYVLQQANMSKGLRLYGRVTDDSGDTIAILQLGPLLSFSRPEPQIDRDSNLHVLFQISARGFNYSVITPEGELKLRQTYDYTDTRPTLRADDTGKIFVAGGVRRQTSNDIPKPQQFEDFPKDEKK